MFLNPQIVLGRPTHEGEQGVNHVDRFDFVKSPKLGQGVLAVGTGKRHRGLEPWNLQNTHAWLLWRWLLMRPRDDGDIMASLSEMSCQMVNHRANTAPTWGIFTRDHGDVHGKNDSEPTFECH